MASSSSSDPSLGISRCSKTQASTEKKRLEYVLDKFCETYARRYKEKDISLQIYMQFLLISRQYGFNSLALEKLTVGLNFDNANRQNRMNRLSQSNSIPSLKPLHNLSIALSEICELERSLGFSKWQHRFINAKIRGTYLRTTDWHKTVITLREAVYNEDWYYASRILARVIPSRRSANGHCARVKRRIRKTRVSTSVVLAPYACSLFRVTVQCLMHMESSVQSVIKSAIIVMKSLSTHGNEKNHLYPQMSNNSMVFAIELWIFAIANGLTEEMHEIVAFCADLPEACKKKSIYPIFRSYRALCWYECWRLNAFMDIDNDKLVEDLLSAVSNTPHPVFIDAMVDFLIAFNQVDSIMLTLMDLCTAAPCMLGYCHTALTQRELQNEADLLLNKIISFGTNLSDSDPLLLKWVELNFASAKDDVDQCCKICAILFNFLDYGENRANERAWYYMWMSVSSVNDANFLSTVWSGRKSWWPKFHRVSMNDLAELCRNKAMNLLNCIDPNSLELLERLV